MQGLSAPCSRGFDRGVYSDSSLYPVYVGGNYNSNPNYGLWYFNANNSSSNSNANLGSRILFEMKISLRWQFHGACQKSRR